MKERPIIFSLTIERTLPLEEAVEFINTIEKGKVSAKLKE